MNARRAFSYSFGWWPRHPLPIPIVGAGNRDEVVALVIPGTVKDAILEVAEIAKGLMRGKEPCVACGRSHRTVASAARCHARRLNPELMELLYVAKWSDAVKILWRFRLNAYGQKKMRKR